MAMRADRVTLIPLDLELGHPGRLLLVSGPNMGGKTVLLKTVGLAVLSAHAAFPFPAEEGSAVPELTDVRADIGDEQSLEQGLSTFAGHLRSLAAMARAAGPGVMVLADELGSGTDPEEGAGLGRALLERFAEREAWGVVTTHLGQLKRVATEVPGVVNGSLEYDAVRMEPLYRFIPGVPGASHGLQVAERMGMPPEVMARARRLTPESARAIERLLQELQETGRGMRDESEKLAVARRDAEEAAEHHRASAESVKQSLARLRGQLTRESEGILARARELWQGVRHETRRAERSRERIEAMQSDLESVERDVEALQARAAEAAGVADERAPLAAEALVPGTRVRVADLGGTVAEVVGPPDAEGRVALRRGAWTIHGRIGRLYAVGAEAASEAGGAREAHRSAATWEVPEEGLRTEVDVRGMDVADALRELDTGLDRAVVAGLGELVIIHGLGKGVLRDAVKRHLNGHSQVASVRMGELAEGGRGVTVARIR
jgi:DNA mismatch repair protein MutS2